MALCPPKQSVLLNMHEDDETPLLSSSPIHCVSSGGPQDTNTTHNSTELHLSLLFAGALILLASSFHQNDRENAFAQAKIFIDEKYSPPEARKMQIAVEIINNYFFTDSYLLVLDNCDFSVKSSYVL